MTCPACACSAPSASPSIPRPGCGIAKPSAATAAPSSTPGGRRKPGTSCSRRIPGAIATKPGSATRPFPGVVPDIVTMEGKPVPDGSGGFLVIKRPWPGMLRTVYGDPDRYVKNYWSQIPGMYFTGDGARKDKDGYFWIMGRVDDVLNVSGHRLSTMEVESALVAHEAVAEAAVVGRPDDLKGQAISAFVTLEQGRQPTPELKEELRKWVAKEIGALAKPDDIRFTDSLPKTRSGKIMRRLLRELATNGKCKRRHHHPGRFRRDRQTARAGRSLGIVTLSGAGVSQSDPPGQSKHPYLKHSPCTWAGTQPYFAVAAAP